LTDAHAAYLAGIIDGEGHIGLNRDSTRYKLGLAVKSTCKELADWIAGTTRLGKVREFKDKRPTSAGTRQVIHEWRVFTNQARSVLESVLIHLIVKREQAMLAIEYQGLPPDERLARGKEFCDRLKWHNARQTHLRSGGQVS
jgi:hypothetical protein